jgi:hypothetical protein
MTRRRRTERDREGAKTTKTAAPTETKGGSAAHVNNITHRPAGGAESGANTLTPLLEAATAAATENSSASLVLSAMHAQSLKHEKLVYLLN